MPTRSLLTVPVKGERLGRSRQTLRQGGPHRRQAGRHHWRLGRRLHCARKSSAQRRLVGRHLVLWHWRPQAPGVRPTGIWSGSSFSLTRRPSAAATAHTSSSRSTSSAWVRFLPADIHLSAQLTSGLFSRRHASRSCRRLPGPVAGQLGREDHRANAAAPGPRG